MSKEKDAIIDQKMRNQLSYGVNYQATGERTQNFDASVDKAIEIALAKEQKEQAETLTNTKFPQ